MPLVRFGGSAYDMEDVSAVARKADTIWRRGVSRMTVVVRGGVALEAEGEDAAALRAFVDSLPMFESRGPSDEPCTVVATPGLGRPLAGEEGG